MRNALASEIYNHFDTSCLAGSRSAYGIIPTGIGGSISTSKPTSLPTYTAEDVFKQVPQLRRKHASVTLNQLEDLKSECESKQIKSIFSKYNIDVNFKYHKDYSTLTSLMHNHQNDGIIELFVYTGTDAYSVLQFFSRTGGNYANIKDDTVGNILKQAAMAQTSHARYQDYNKLARYIQNESIVIPLFYMNHGTLLKNCLSGVSEDFFTNPALFIPKLTKSNSCAN